MSTKRHNGVPLDNDDQWLLNYIYKGGSDKEEVMRRYKITSNERLQSVYRRIIGAFKASSLVDAARKAKAAGII